MKDHDLIRALIEIARHAYSLHHMAVPAEDSPTQLLVPIEDYEALADALAALEVLPQPSNTTLTGPARAAAQLEPAMKLMAMDHVELKLSVDASEVKDLLQNLDAGFHPDGLVGEWNQPCRFNGLPGQEPVRGETVTAPPVPHHPIMSISDEDAKEMARLLEFPDSWSTNFKSLGDAVMDVLHRGGEALTREAEFGKIYSVEYVENLLTAVADVATDGRRFRAAGKAMLDIANNSADHEHIYDAITLIRDNLLVDGKATTLDQVRQVIDAAIAAEIIFDESADFDTFSSTQQMAVLREQALELANWVADENIKLSGNGKRFCHECGADIEIDDIIHEHKPGCIVNVAKQLIEDNTP